MHQTLPDLTFFNKSTKTNNNKFFKFILLGVGILAITSTIYVVDSMEKPETIQNKQIVLESKDIVLKNILIEREKVAALYFSNEVSLLGYLEKIKSFDSTENITSIENIRLKNKEYYKNTTAILDQELSSINKVIIASKKENLKIMESNIFLSYDFNKYTQWKNTNVKEQLFFTTQLQSIEDEIKAKFSKFDNIDSITLNKPKIK